LLLGLLATLSVFVFVVFGVLWLSVPPDRQMVRIAGLSAPVDIDFDENGVPRIKAANERDAATAIGFVHARDRMFQMDLMRRAASGRLSELAGPATLAIDRQMRIFGLGHLAEGDVEAQSPETRTLLEAYARGVNSWIAERGRFAAMEFLLLGAPEPWRPSDSLLWGRTMGLWLSSNYRTELSRQALRDKFPLELLKELWPPAPVPPRPDASLMPRSPDDRWNGSPKDERRADVRYASTSASVLPASLPAFPAPFTLPSTASDAWAVDGRLSDTGAPLLAGDPHLSFGFPGLWYLVRVETPGQVLAGATGPGVPFLILGHNARIAWTFTTTGADTQDVYLEPPDAAFASHEERIKVRGQPDTVFIVRQTRHGPVISDPIAREDDTRAAAAHGKEAAGDAAKGDTGRRQTNREQGAPRGETGGGPVMAVAMVNLLPHDTGATGLLALNHAGSVEEAGKSAALIGSPVQNLMVADRAAIGLFVTGRVPIRRAGNGWAPEPGGTAGEIPGGVSGGGVGPVADDDPYGWTGFASGEALPHIVSPASGRLINGNEPVAPPDFPVFMGLDTFRDWRARRIRTLLDSLPKHSTSDFAAMQVDVVSTYAAALLPMLRVVPGAPQVLRDWDGAMTQNDSRPLIFSAWMNAFHHAVLAKAGIPMSASAPAFEFIPFVLSPEGAHWCGGDCAPLLKTTFDNTMSSLAARFGRDPAGWRWGAVHQAEFAHPFLRSIPVLSTLTTLRISMPGDGATLDRGGTDDTLASVHGAAYRGVYDLADLDRSLFVVAPGQSGNPLSRHARDFLTRWRDGAMVLLGPVPVGNSGTVRLEP
jgi:penicillin amidase